MKIVCHHNNYVSKPARYVIEYMLNRCGFFFEWIAEPESAEPNALILQYAPVKETLKSSAPVLHIASDYDLPNLHQAELKWESRKFNQTEIPLLLNEGRDIPSSQIYHFISFDLIANIYYHLARIDELNFQHPDDVDKNVKNAVLFKYGEFKIPVVDVLIQWFSKQIDRVATDNQIIKFTKAHYPSGEAFAIALTHDVDFIRAYHPLKKTLKKWSVRLGLNRTDSIEKIEQYDGDQWGFDHLLDFYKSKNYQATFFFIAKYLEKRSLRYRIAGKKIKKLFRGLRSEHHEIAFHPSRYAFEQPSRYSKEKRKLQRVAGTPLTGMRHHYLRCTYPEIWDIAKALGLAYNSGLIYRRNSGFRAGTSFPFPAYNHRKQALTGVVEFPILFFENTLPDEGHDLKKSRETINLMMQIIQERQGYFTLLWHTNNFSEPEDYAKLWRYITDLIENSHAFLTTLHKHAQWQRQRNAIQLTELVRTTGPDFHFSLVLPPDTQQFTLAVPRGYHYKISSGFDFIHTGELLKISNSNHNSVIEIRAVLNA